MRTRDEDPLLRLAKAVADGIPVDWAREAAAQPELRVQLEKLQALAGIAALNFEAAPDPLVGQTLSHYRIRERLGAGGMGVVYRAEDQRLRRPVALKVLPPKLVASEERRRRLLREARAEAAAVHPSIAAVHEIGEAEGNVFIAMELVEGETLHERIGGRPLPIREALPLAIEMAEGLAHAHGAGVIHRDLKPANVVIRPDGHVKILDFGLAKLVEDETDSGLSEASQPQSLSTERAGKLMGTPAYMSPEQVRGEPLDARSDIFSFGSTLDEMVTGKAPFRRPSLADTLTSILRDQPPSPSRLNPEVPLGLQEIIARCLEKDPQDRYPGANEIAADLRTLANPAPPRLTRSRMRWTVAAGVAALLLALASFWLVNRPAPEALPGHSLAVLPFVSLSADPDQEYFADGIAEELLNTFGRFEGLRVVGRTSSFSFRNSDADLKTIGEALGVGVILEGSVRTAGNRVRITAQLVDVEDGYQRWSETYERELNDIFAIQTEIATAIATALRIRLSAEERDRLARAPTQNLLAYQAYLLGRQRLEKSMTTTTEEAIGYFQQALELDPKLAVAHVGLTKSYLEQFQNSDLPPDEMLARAQAAADKALELDDGLAETHVALGQVKWWRNDFEGAEAAFQRALALNPNSVMAYDAYGNLLSADLARYEEGLMLHRKAVELDPLSVESIANLIGALYSPGRFDEALAWSERLLEIDPGYAWGHQLIGVYHLSSGRLDEAVVWWAKGVALDPGSPFGLANLGWLFLELGDPNQAEYWINRSVELSPENIFPNIAMQGLGVYRGDEAAALHHGRKAFATWPLESNVLTLLRDHEVRAGRYIEARALYEEWFPELLVDPDPKVDARNYLAAVDLALILSRTGQRERAELLLDRGLQQIQSRSSRAGKPGYGFADVQIYALQEEKQKALSALRAAIDEGWRAGWWWWLQKPDLESLHDEPEFQAMLEEIRADMAAQLERVREMERRGELTFPAELPTPRDHASSSSPPDPR